MDKIPRRSARGAFLKPPGPRSSGPGSPVSGRRDPVLRTICGPAGRQAESDPRLVLKALMGVQVSPDEVDDLFGMEAARDVPSARVRKLEDRREPLARIAAGHPAPVRISLVALEVEREIRHRNRRDLRPLHRIGPGIVAVFQLVAEPTLVRLSILNHQVEVSLAVPIDGLSSGTLLIDDHGETFLFELLQKDDSLFKQAEGKEDLF